MTAPTYAVCVLRRFKGAYGGAPLGDRSWIGPETKPAAPGWESAAGGESAVWYRAGGFATAEAAGDALRSRFPDAPIITWGT